MSAFNGKPTPGSDAALAQGCTCPVLDNAHGKGWMLNPDLFWISEGCPLHSRPEPMVDEDNESEDDDENWP